MYKKAISITIIASTFLFMNSCVDTGSLFSDFTPVKNSTGSNDEQVRGPSGGGAGGGVIIVEKNGTPFSNVKYDVYIKEGFSKQKIQSGTTDNSGKITLSENSLSSTDAVKIGSGKASIIVEVIDGEEKQVADGKIILNSDDSEVDLGSA